MNVTLGHAALMLALGVALVQAVLPLWGAQRGRVAWMAVAPAAAMLQFALVAVAYAGLSLAFVQHDFSVKVVAHHSNTLLPLPYRLAAVWGSHEGSMLLWTLMLAGWGLALAWLGRPLGRVLHARMLGVMGALGCAFLLFTVMTSDPFERAWPSPVEGRDLNPLLQDPAMVAHPPLLYMGYVGFSVVFALAIGALLGGRLDAAWARWSRPWATAAWSFLTLGIALGSYWAYYELGWGGWWFWDPVENASLLPWLAGTALIHTLAMAERRGSFRLWTALLAILTFSLSLLGTFLVRSGVLNSVHSFASDPTRGVWLLALLALVTGSSLAVLAWRAHELHDHQPFAWLSREATLLANNVLLLVAAAAVMLGTLYPLILDALGGGKLSVGPPYFDAVFVPLMAPALFLMGVGPVVRWRQHAAPDVARRLRWALAVSLASGLLLPLWLGEASVAVVAGLLLASWIACATLAALHERVRGLPLRDWSARLWRQGGGLWGMALAHLGVAVLVAGITLVKGYELERDVQLARGESAALGDYRFRFDGVTQQLGENYLAARGVLVIEQDGRVVARLHPEKRVYAASGQAMAEAAIASRWHGDLYVSLGEPASGDVLNGAWGLRLHVKPFVAWIWAGALLMALGGATALADRRYRRRHAASTAAEPAAPMPVGPALLPQGRPS